MRSKNPACPNFLDKKDARFSQHHKTLDSYFHKLHSEGVGRQTKHAEVITSDEQDQLWKTTTPTCRWQDVLPLRRSRTLRTTTVTVETTVSIMKMFPKPETEA